MKYGVFISYRREGGDKYARTIQQALEKHLLIVPSQLSATGAGKSVADFLCLPRAERCGPMQEKGDF